MVRSTGFAVSYLILWLTALTEGAAILWLYKSVSRSIGAPSRREAQHSQGAAVGSRLTARTLETVGGRPVQLGGFMAGPMLLVFMSASCRVCQLLRAQLRQFAQQCGDIKVLVICAGSRLDVDLWSEELGKKLDVIADTNSALFASYGIKETPFVFAVDRFGIVRDKAGFMEAHELKSVAAKLISPDSAPSGQ